GFEIAHGEPFFDYLSKNEAAASVFNQNMLATTREESAEITTAYYFPEKGVLVDIGGGHGALTEALLEKYPQLNAWVFDLPEVIDSARARWDSSPFKDQIRLISGSFFDSIPSGGDLYCLKDILHDWNDEDCARILKNCRAAMSPEAKLCIIERFLPEDGSASPARRIDMIMMILTGGLERTELEYRQLLEQAGFKIGKIVATPGGTGIIEAQPDGRLTGPERTL
ncbi:MAG: methyltransferase, partial [Anaerolineales bacterium]|nr:methyltransferase [Anaerolineales bacterium]